MNLEHLLGQRLEGSIKAVSHLREQLPQIAHIVEAIRGQLNAGGTIYTAGNGGSAAQALHLAEELIGRYRGNRPPLRAICLNADPTALTCIANDFGFDQVFARQGQALLTPVDVLLVLSTSGNSPNLIKALEVAREKDCMTIALLGKDGGSCRPLSDQALVINSDDSAHIQDAHQVVLHMICEAFER
jgi:D-sedoheptulose 7-phosphate isomerase